MCGIVGLVHADPARPASAAAIRRMCDAIRHRGPDDEGVYVEGAVGLGMRRLSIIDLAGGRQPIFNEDRSKVIVFNGEIYNYRELRGRLLARGHTFATQSDTETILHLYEEHGPDCVQQLRGMFAFAIWDRTAQTLLLARDRFGMKPLYVAAAPWGIAFASELKALHAAGLTDRELDWHALDTYFQLGYIPAPATPFRDVCKLEPGHVAVWHRARGLSIRQYWDLPQEREPAPRDVEARIVDWLDESVRAHLVSDVPVAAFLSGGLDSSAVVASWALASDAPHAFTARYFGSGAASADETDLARRLAARYGVKLTEVEIHPGIRDLLEPITYALDEPHADASAVPTWLLSQAVSASYRVALTGIGGDELFAGYRRHIGFLMGEGYTRLPRAVQRGVSALANLVREPRDGSLAVDRVKRFLRPGNGAGAAPALRARAAQSAERQRRERPAARAAPASRRARRAFGRAVSGLQDVPRRRRAGAERPHGNGALARDPGPAGGPRAGGAGVPAPRSRQDRLVAEQTAAEAGAALPPARGASARPEARLRGSDGGMAAARAARCARGRARSRPVAATRLLRAGRGSRSARRSLLAPPQPRRDPVGAAVLFGVAPGVRGGRACSLAKGRRKGPERRAGGMNTRPRLLFF